MLKPIFAGQFGGLSNSKFSGLRGSFYRLVGIDAQSEPGILKIRQKLAKDSGATVTELCKISITASDGSTLWFSFISGKIWRRTSDGVWTLVHTTAPTSGGAGCSGGKEYDGYIYWATEGFLHRKPVNDLSDWSDAVDNWATFANTDPDFHPMVLQGVSLFIGDKNYVAKVYKYSGVHTFVSNALDIRQPHRIKTMVAYGIDLVIGTFIHENVNLCSAIRWDTQSGSWSVADSVEENGINAFIKDGNYYYAQAGRNGRMYYYNGKSLEPAYRIPGDWSPTQTAYINPDAVTIHQTIPLFGLSNVAGNPQLQGVYSFGSYSKDYPKVLDLAYPVSAGLTGIEIGSVRAVGSDLLVSWSDGTNCGVDKLDWVTKYQNAYIETGILTSPELRSFLKSNSKIIVNYADVLPADCGLTIKYKKAYEANYSDALKSVIDTKLVQERVENIIPDIAALQLRFEFITNLNNAPKIESIFYDL